MFYNFTILNISVKNMPEQDRLDKLEKIKAMGINPYPYSYNQENHASEIKANYEKFEGKTTSVAGRIVGERVPALKAHIAS